jgi:hypothetical protein
MAVGVTQPGGVGTTIFVFDNASAADTIAYHFAEISAAFPADFVDNGTTPKSYRSKVSLQVGDTGVGTAATTLSDTNVTVIFDATKQLVYRNTQLSSWSTVFGTKTGTGNQASGRSGVNIYSSGTITTIRGNIQLYGSRITATGRLTINNALTGLTGDVVNCLLESTGTGVISGVDFGATGFPFDNIYDVDVMGAVVSGAVGITQAIVANTMERVTFGGNPPAFIRSSSLGITAKDIAFFGTPVTSDVIWTGTAATSNWVFIRPRWSGNAPKFSGGGLTNDPANGTHEYWGWDVKTVDRNGAAVANIPVKLTDIFGNVAVDTLTGANGQVTYGSGISANFTVVRDHYPDAAGAYAVRDRSPFTVEINVGPAANSNYLSRVYKFDWPGLSTGNFEDISDVVPIQDQSGGATSWHEYELGVWP